MDGHGGFAGPEMSNEGIFCLSHTAVLENNFQLLAIV